MQVVKGSGFFLHVGCLTLGQPSLGPVSHLQMDKVPLRDLTDFKYSEFEICIYVPLLGLPEEGCLNGTLWLTL